MSFACRAGNRVAIAAPVKAALDHLIHASALIAAPLMIAWWDSLRPFLGLPHERTRWWSIAIVRGWPWHRIMSPRYKHECPDWDFMELDEHSAELVGCACFSDPEFLAIREGHSRELDRINEAASHVDRGTERG